MNLLIGWGLWQKVFLDKLLNDTQLLLLTFEIDFLLPKCWKQFIPKCCKTWNRIEQHSSEFQTLIATDCSSIWIMIMDFRLLAPDFNIFINFYIRTCCLLGLVWTFSFNVIPILINNHSLPFYHFSTSFLFYCLRVNEQPNVYIK